MDTVERIFKIIFPIMEICLPILLGYLVWVLKEDRKERKATTLGLKEILGYMIDRWHNEIMFQGYITSDQRNTLEGIFQAYAANKGNGARKAKWEEIKKIRIDDTKPNTSLYFELLKKSQEKNKIK